VEIRAARADELDAIGELTVTAYRSVPGVSVGGYEGALRDAASRSRDALLLVAAERDRLLGTVTCVLGPGPFAETDDPHEGTIRMLAVAPDARRRGVGEALVRACLARARSAGLSRIGLYTQPTMDSAQRLYDRLGFRRSPERDWPVPDSDLTLLSYTLELGGSAR
jgi:ribosomal protein S18 acetylase RimI-like enzyme